MVSATDLLAQANALGVVIRIVEGGVLEASPPGASPPSLRNELQLHRADVIRALAPGVQCDAALAAVQAEEHATLVRRDRGLGRVNAHSDRRKSRRHQTRLRALRGTRSGQKRRLDSRSFAVRGSLTGRIGAVDRRLMSERAMLRCAA